MSQLNMQTRRRVLDRGFTEPYNFKRIFWLLCGEQVWAGVRMELGRGSLSVLERIHRPGRRQAWPFAGQLLWARRGAASGISC